MHFFRLKQATAWGLHWQGGRRSVKTFFLCGARWPAVSHLGNKGHWHAATLRKMWTALCTVITNYSLDPVACARVSPQPT